MEVRVLFFASIREAAGVKGVTVTLEAGNSTDHLKEALSAQFPQLREPLSTITLAVNKSYVFNATTLHNGDEVAFLPPISGG